MKVQAMFFTLEDPNAKIKGSRDPLGAQPIWTAFGRHVVTNLTTQSNSARGFSILLLGRYFAGRAIEDGRIGRDQALDAFLRFEQIGAYVRHVAHDVGGDIRGIERVRSKVEERGGLVPIRADSEGLILGDQKVNGLWGLFSVPARVSRLIPEGAVGLTSETTEFVEREYLPILRPVVESLSRLVAKNGQFDTGAHDEMFSGLSRVLSETFTGEEQRFYGEYLRDGLHVKNARTGSQQRFRELLFHNTRLDEWTDRSEILTLRDEARSVDDALAIRLDRIGRIEAVLAPSMSLFDFMLTRNRRELDELAEELAERWGAFVPNIDVEKNQDLLDEIGSVLSAAVCGCFDRVQRGLSGGSYRHGLSALLDWHKTVMNGRGGAAWVQVGEDGKLDVRYRGAEQELPSGDDLPELWAKWLLHRFAEGHHPTAWGRGMTEVAGRPEAVLSRRLGEAIQGRSVRSAVFTTFNFDPGFFELQVLPVLFSQSFSQADKVRLLQLEDALRDVDHVAVYYDRGALSQDAEPARLDYSRIDVRRRTGVFHPKLAFLLVDEPKASEDDADEVYQSLVVACLSANLSRAGWWENVECAHIEEVRDNDIDSTRVPYRRDLLAILRRIRTCAAEDDNHHALDAIHAFLRDRVPHEQYVNARAGGRWYTRLFGGEGRLDLANWLEELRLGSHDWNLEVISPYFDARGAGPLQKLVGVIVPRKTRVFLPRDSDGSALVTADAYNATAKLDGVRWAGLPSEITQRSGGASGERLAPRRVHAKVYRLWNQDGGDVVIVGSVNCTSPAHRHGGAGNLESAFLVDISGLNLPRRWWLKPLERDDAHRFAETAPDESDGLDVQPFGVSMRYHWGKHTLAVRFEREMPSPIDVTDISGQHLFTIKKGDVEQWRPCDKYAADAVRESLASSSFVVLRRDGTQWRVLVREEGMAHRPSILSELSPDEILEYWSLLSAEERSDFIERRAAFDEDIEGIPTSNPDGTLGTGNTLFDRFAGVFHAFGCLRRNIEAALDDNRHKDAEMRLLGAKYDSLPELLRNLLDREDRDPVLNYVTFLTAKQVRNSLRKRDPQFFRDRRSLVRKLDMLIAKGIERRDQIFPGEDAQTHAFLEWFEPVFLKDLGHL